MQRSNEVSSGRYRCFIGSWKCISSRDMCPFLLTATVIMLPSGLFICFDCVYLVKNVSLVIGIGAAVLLLFVLASLFMTTFSDPGIIPCSTPREAASNLQCLSVYKRHIRSSNQQHSCKVNVQIDGKNLKLRYCYVCNQLQSPRAWHCNKCNECIERFDHHSQLLRNCIGEWNYHYYYYFLVSLLLWEMYMLGCITAHIVLLSQQTQSLVNALSESPASPFVFFVSFGFMCVVARRTIVSTFMVARNYTRLDMKRRRWINPSGKTENPFNKGSCFANFKDVLFTCRDQSSRRVSLHDVFLQYALQRIEEEDEAEELSRSTPSLLPAALLRSQSAPEGLQKVQKPDPLHDDLSRSEINFRSKILQATSTMVVCSTEVVINVADAVSDGDQMVILTNRQTHADVADIIDVE